MDEDPALCRGVSSPLVEPCVEEKAFNRKQPVTQKTCLILSLASAPFLARFIACWCKETAVDLAFHAVIFYLVCSQP